ncbi:MAG: carboxymuconolactone decarboxylase family protein [Planctomycetota bacterium]
MSKGPKAYNDFIRKFPDLGKAWEQIGEAGKKGPLDERTCRLIKFGIAAGAQKEGPAHASVRKALKMGISVEELEQVVVLLAGTLGMPAAVTAFCWIRDEVDRKKK